MSKKRYFLASAGQLKFKQKQEISLKKIFSGTQIKSVFWMPVFLFFVVVWGVTTMYRSFKFFLLALLMQTVYYAYLLCFSDLTETQQDLFISLCFRRPVLRRLLWKWMKFRENDRSTNKELWINYCAQEIVHYLM